MSEDWGGVRELASHYVQLISKEQRHGPYFLGGYSYGGLLAYEMASLLTEQNQRVECVAMIDTFPWSPLSQTISTRLVSMQEDGHSHRRHVKVRGRRSNTNLNLQISFPKLNDCFKMRIKRRNYCVHTICSNSRNVQPIAKIVWKYIYISHFSFADTICLVVFYRFSIEVIFMTAASIWKLLEKVGARFP